MNRPWSDVDIAQLRCRAAAGQTQAVAAQALGRTAAAVSVAASLHKISFHGKRRAHRAVEVSEAQERARRALADELASAKRERSTAPLYRGGPP